MNPREDELPFLTYVNAVAPAVLTIATIRISVSRSPMLHHSSFRSLARLCQVQASLATDDRTRRVLEQMATEYTRKADHEEAADGAGDNPQHVVVKKLR